MKGRWEDRSAAVVEHDCGKGKAVYCGFSPGLCYRMTEDRGILRWMRKLAAGAGVVPAWNVTKGKDVVVQELETQDGGRLVFLFNMRDASQEVEARAAHGKLGSVESIGPSARKLSVAGRTLKTRMEPLGVACARVGSNVGK